MRNKMVVVTGGAGFIGSNICYALCDENDLVAIDDLSSGRKENIRELIDGERVTFHNHSIADLDYLRGAFSGADYVLHYAAMASVPMSVARPLEANETNVNGTLNVLIAARDSGVKKVVFASSSAVYGDEASLPASEGSAPNPISPYAVTKLAGECYCRAFANIYGLNTISLRYFNIYGPMQDPSSQYAAVIPKFIERASCGQPPIIYGDGFQTRDFCHVDDAILANTLACESRESGTFNISGGARTTINELADEISDLCGYEGDSVHEGARKGDIGHSYADISMAKERLGFEPRVPLRKGLARTVGWYGSKRDM